MIDIKDISGVEDNFIFLMRKQSKNKFGPRESLKSLSTRYWYESLRMSAGLTTPYSVEQQFEPNAFSLNSSGGIAYKINKWSKYKRGLNTPRPKMLDMIERQSPGSTRELNHPLWMALDIRNSQIFAGDSFLRLLVPNVQSLLLHSDEKTPSLGGRRPTSRSKLYQLVQRGNMDALACLTWLLRESCAVKPDEPSPFVLAIHRLLVILSIGLENLNIADSVLQIFIQEIIPIGLPAHLKLDMSPADYVTQSYILNTVAHHDLVKSGQTASLRNRLKHMVRMIKGMQGLDLLFALQPRYGLADGYAEDSFGLDSNKPFRFSSANHDLVWDYLLYQSCGRRWPPVAAMT